LSYIKFPRGFRGLTTVETDGQSLRIKTLELVQTRMSQCYLKVNIVFDYCRVELYFHTFSAPTLDADMPLNWRLQTFPRWKGHLYALNSRHCVTTQKKRTGQRNVLLHNYGDRTTFIWTVGQSQYTLNFVGFRQNSHIIQIRSKDPQVKTQVVYEYLFHLRW